MAMTAGMTRKASAEALGTFWLVLGGCGTAVLGSDPGLGPHMIGVPGIALAFGLTVLTMAYAIGPISGCHLNPAVSLGMVVARRMPAKDLLPYVLAQVLGAIAAAGVILAIAKGRPGGYDAPIQGLAANGYGEAHSPGHYALASALVVEVLATFVFMIVILGATSKRAAAGFAGVAIGLCLTLVHLLSIPVTNTSVNPARSTGPALFVGGWAVEQLWLFWLAPAVGAALAAVAWRVLDHEPAAESP